MLSISRLANQLRVSPEVLRKVPFTSGDYRISFTFPDRVYSDFKGNHPKTLEPGIVVDAGCSYGMTTMALCHLYPQHRIYGCDVEEDRLPRPKDIPAPLRDRLTFAHGDLFHLDRLFRPSSVACIYAMNNLTYLVGEDYSQFNEPVIMKLFAARVHKILTPNGYICISGHGDRLRDFATAIIQKTPEGFKPVHVNEAFGTSPGLDELCHAFNVPFRYIGT